MMRPRFFFALFLFVAAILFMRATLSYPPKARLFPLVTLTFLVVLLIIQMVREVLALKEKKGVTRGRPHSVVSKHIVIWAWIVATLIMLWLFGFTALVVLLPFLYLRSVKENWTLSVILPLGCGLFFLRPLWSDLKMPLYRGWVFQRILG